MPEVNPIDFLQAYSELAVALIGFSGIVLALRHRSDSESSFETIAVSMLVGIGSLALVCSIAPQILIAAGIDQEITWRLMSIGIVAMQVFGATLRTRQARQSGGNFNAITGRIVSVLMASATVVAATNIYFATFWIFMINLMIYIVVCTTIFANLLLP